MPPLQYSNLLRELEEHNVFFDELVDMIPAKLYVAGNSGDDKYNSKYFKGQHKQSKESRRARSKAAKRIKFDPERMETTRQVKERLAREEEEHDSGDENENVPPGSPKGSKSKGDKDTTTTATTNEDPDENDVLAPTSRIEALRAKLHAKLAEKRGQRPADPNAVSKRAGRRAEKQKRQEEAKKRRAMTKVSDKTTQYKISAGVPSAQSDLEGLDYGKLAGLNAKPKNFANNKSLANINKKKNLHKMLEEAEAKQQKLEELKKGSVEDKAKAQELVWSEALKEASGDRVKDDPALIRKALKRKIAKKEKSAKAWKSRTEQTKAKMDERQQIRNHNLGKRKLGGAAAANLSSKRIVDDAAAEEEKTTRKSRAGFEGKKQGFLNNQKANAKSKDKAQ